jgi:predicted site-specific integrase-resolvase
MYTSLTEAAEAVGKSRTTIQRAIKSGKISASKDSHGNYSIDPSELHRVFMKRTVTSHVRASGTERNSNETHQKDSDLRVLEVKLKAAEEMSVERAKTIDDLRERLDKSEAKVTALLTDQRPKGFWSRLRGR